MFRLTCFVLLAAVGLMSPRWARADELGEDEHLHEHAHECPEGFQEHEGGCYYFSDTAATFPAAAAQCAALDGRLAEPDCEDEHANEFFYSAVYWISPNTDEDCIRGQQSPQDQLPYICMHAPTCPDPPVVNNTVVTNCATPYDQQETCNYECAPGHHRFEGTESSSSATCLDGNWHGPFMSCYVNCPTPTLNPGVRMTGTSCEAPYITGDICFFECSNGQEPTGGDHDMSCVNGVWMHAAQNLPGEALVCPTVVFG